jgi:predicted TIM-barrel fold metal-dependent hydrolase
MKSRSGRQKVMFGTNYPMIFHQQALEHLDHLRLDSEACELFVAGNAQRVLGLQGARPNVIVSEAAYPANEDSL